MLPSTFRSAVFLGSLLALAAGLSPGKETGRPAGEARKSLQGTWELVLVEHGFRQGYPGAAPMNYVFKGDEFASFIYGRSDGNKGTARFGPNKALDVTVTDGPAKGSNYAWLYEVKGDTLRIAFDFPSEWADVGKRRPGELKAKLGSTTAIWTFSRVDVPNRLPHNILDVLWAACDSIGEFEVFSLGAAGPGGFAGKWKCLKESGQLRARAPEIARALQDGVTRAGKNKGGVFRPRYGARAKGRSGPTLEMTLDFESGVVEVRLGKEKPTTWFLTGKAPRRILDRFLAGGKAPPPPRPRK
jgi:uncharacterized protein (TIGR03067 family)